MVGQQSNQISDYDSTSILNKGIFKDSDFPHLETNYSCMQKIKFYCAWSALLAVFGPIKNEYRFLMCHRL